VHERETIATQTARMREHDRKHCGSGDGGIDGVAACAQHLEGRR
jgi:hypothetical protein